jgi:hypothetical protein
MSARAEYEAKSLSRTRPWDVEGISRRTWYNRRAKLDIAQVSTKAATLTEVAQVPIEQDCTSAAHDGAVGCTSAAAAEVAQVPFAQVQEAIVPEPPLPDLLAFETIVSAPIAEPQPMPDSLAADLFDLGLPEPPPAATHIQHEGQITLENKAIEPDATETENQPDLSTEPLALAEALFDLEPMPPAGLAVDEAVVSAGLFPAEPEGLECPPPEGCEAATSVTTPRNQSVLPAPPARCHGGANATDAKAVRPKGYTDAEWQAAIDHAKRLGYGQGL